MLTMKPGPRSRRRAVPLAAALLALSAHAQAADAEVAGEILVKLRSTGALAPLLTRHDLTLVAGFGPRPMYRLKVTGNANVHDKIDALKAEIDVLIAEPNVVHQSPEARKNHAWAIGTESEYKAQCRRWHSRASPRWPAPTSAPIWRCTSCRFR